MKNEFVSGRARYECKKLQKMRKSFLTMSPGHRSVWHAAKKLEEKFQEVKKYIQDNGHAGIQQVAEACDVSTNQIHQWLREERLELSAESGVTLSCENCGAAILSGRFCAKCKNTMVNELGASIKKPEPPKVQKKKDTKENPKMRFLN